MLGRCECDPCTSGRLHDRHHRQINRAIRRARRRVWLLRLRLRLGIDRRHQ